MADFSKFQAAIHKQLTKMAKTGLFEVDVSKDDLWDTYLGSFRPKDNPIFRERTEHDCNCCKSFIRVMGNVVTIIDNKLVSIWDCEVEEEAYQIVADKMATLVKSAPIRDVFLHDEAKVGVKTTKEYDPATHSVANTWNHFYFNLPSRYVYGGSIGTKLSEIRSTKDVFKRSVEELTLDAAETVRDLIDQNSLYRGKEHKETVQLFITEKIAYQKVPVEERDNYCWKAACEKGPMLRIKNTVIGSLLSDLSLGRELEAAVTSFETKVAPANYKRPTALVTKRMVQDAHKKAKELGIEDSLYRRYAKADDITINNVLFADRSIKKAMNVFDEISDEVPSNLGNLKKVEEVSLDTFIENILPKAKSLEVMVENRHKNNLMSILAPQYSDAEPILKWGNNFSWVYNGEVADSMKERVKRAGGNVDGVLRFSIQWNENNDNSDDLDAHCFEPNGNHIHFTNKGKVHKSSGKLDVDIITPGKSVAVENIIYTNKGKMEVGEYHFFVHNYSRRGGTGGFTAEIEYDGQTFTYHHPKPLRQGQKVTVAKVTLDKAGNFSIKGSLESTKASQNVWGVATESFQKVSMVMNSPNYWDDKGVGNKHLFFILDKCKNEEPARGFFNEFLRDDLTPHRKVFEVLGSKMKAEPSEKQLSGVGFSTTQRNSFLCKVSGSFNRTVKVIV